MIATATAPNELAATGEETCAVCGRETGLGAFCHIYRDGRTINLCDAHCADLFLHRDESDSSEPSLWAGVHEHVHY